MPHPFRCRSFCRILALLALVSAASARPVIRIQPQNVSVLAGQTVALHTAAAGTGLRYEWKRLVAGGTAVPVGTGPVLTFAVRTAADAGIYFCEVSDGDGTETSAGAIVALAAPGAAAGRLVNLAVRTVSGTGAQVLNVGVTLAGGGAGGTSRLLFRAVGPGLAPFGVTGLLADPTLAVRPLNAAEPIAGNDNWGGATDVAAAAAAAGAFPLPGPGSADAALLATLGPGSFTAVAAGVGTGTGTVLTEIYETAAAANAPRLVNLSARAQVGTGDGLLIAGFVIGGPTAKTVLVRAAGPALGALGVPGTLADPKLEIIAGTRTVGENENWGGSPALTAAFAQVGAFAFGSGASRDAAIMITLPPGAYSAQVSGADGGTGIGLVEVYELP